jgi:hypothetical protein
MWTRRRVIGVAAAVMVIVALTVGVAAATTSGAPAGSVDFSTGGRVDTPSGTFVTLTTQTVTAAPGPIVVRFSGEGYVQDFNSQAAFVGRSYAAMRVRVLLNGVPMSPGRVNFIDNSGKIAVRRPRPTAASFEWAGTVATAGNQEVMVQFRNRRVFDSATLLRWALVIQHA